jgi:uncharacterized protein YuzB (UPF0349 family)
VNTFTCLMALASGADTGRSDLCADAVFTVVEACVAAEAMLLAEPENEGVASLYALLSGNLRMMEANMTGVEHACR